MDGAIVVEVVVFECGEEFGECGLRVWVGCFADEGDVLFCDVFNRVSNVWFVFLCLSVVECYCFDDGVRGVGVWGGEVAVYG